MNLDFSDDQKFVQQSARDFLAKNAGLEVCRKALESTSGSSDPTLWKGVAEMGWLGAAVPESFGGAGLGYLELVLIAEEIGRSLAPIPFGSSVYLATEAILLFGSDAQKKAWLPRLASGEIAGTFAFAEGTGEADADSVATRFVGGKLTGTKVPVLDGEGAGVAVVVAKGAKGPILSLADLSASGVERSRLESFDPSRSVAKISFRDAPAEVLGSEQAGAAQLDTLLDRAAVMMGFEQIGGATRAFEITREFTLGRYAFGRPIASFQAVKHRLAELYAKIEIARSNGYYAAWALSTDSSELSLAACGFRAAASDAFELASEEMIQLHGGVGFTWEYDCHMFYRRAKWLSAALGTPSAWREKLIQRIEAKASSVELDAESENTMNFEDTPLEAAFRTKTRAWLEKNARLRPPGETAGNALGERESAEVIQQAKDWQSKKFDESWAVLTWPKEYGGQGLGRLEAVVWSQEEAKFDVPPNLYAIGHGMLGPTIMAHGNDEQKNKYVKKMARGQEIWCQLFSEPDAGSDLAGLRTSAVKDGSDWVINGQKIWSTGAHYSDFGMIVTRTDPEAAKHAGLTYFIVDMHAKGVEIRPIKQINGASGFNTVFFSDVRVPDTNRLGAVGDGWGVAITTLMNERVAIGAGGGAGRFKDLLKLARDTRRNGRAAIEDSAVRQKLADFYIRSKGLQYTGYRTLSALSRGATPGPEGSIGKAVGAPLGQEMASFAMELQGVMGAVSDPSVSPQAGLWQEMYLGTPGIRIAGGTDEILKNIIAERVLRLPPEIRVDKDRPFREIPTGSMKR